jgi:hypothetical protein
MVNPHAHRTQPGGLIDVLDTEEPHILAEGPRTRRRRTRWIRWTLAIVAGALVASTLGYLIDDQKSENNHYDRVHASLLVTRHRAANVGHDLDVLRHDVAILVAQVGSASTSWNQDTAQLKAARFALAVVQSDVSQQGSRIGSLHTCLGGVQQALNALAVNNQTIAVSELNSAASSCSAASGG